jgi:hypothetical protein
MSGYRVEITITEGELVEGAFVRMSTVGYAGTGQVAFRSTSSGVYVGKQLDEGQPYHMFRDGEINGHPQAHLGSPVEQFLSAPVIADGKLVTFRPDFSEQLKGIVWEICPMPTDEAMTRTVQNGPDEGKVFCQLRRRVGKRGRWGYRFAWITDLVPAQEA